MADRMNFLKFAKKTEAQPQMNVHTMKFQITVRKY